MTVVLKGSQVAHEYSLFGQKTAPDLLKSEIDAAGLATALDYITTEEITDADGATTDLVCSCVFADALSDADKTTLDGLVGSHTGVRTTAVFYASSKMIDDEILLVGSDWSDLAGVVSNPAFFSTDVASMVGKIIGAMLVTGTGAQLRLIETAPDKSVVDMTPTPYDLLDTAGAYVAQSFMTQVAPRPTSNIYTLQGKLGLATLAAIKFTSLTLLRIKTE